MYARKNYETQDKNTRPFPYSPIHRMPTRITTVVRARNGLTLQLALGRKLLRDVEGDVEAMPTCTPSKTVHEDLREAARPSSA